MLCLGLLLDVAVMREGWDNSFSTISMVFLLSSARIITYAVLINDVSVADVQFILPKPEAFSQVHNRQTPSKIEQQICPPQ